MKKLACIVVVAAVVGATVGCAHRYAVTVDGPRGRGADAELAIQEMLVRNLVAGEPAGETVLVSFGGSKDNPVDPPDAFLERMTDLPVSLRPVSQFDTAISADAVLVEIKPIQWDSDTVATVALKRVRFGVGASDGFLASVRWDGGAWSIAGTSKHWNT